MANMKHVQGHAAGNQRPTSTTENDAQDFPSGLAAKIRLVPSMLDTEAGTPHGVALCYSGAEHALHEAIGGLFISFESHDHDYDKVWTYLLTVRVMLLILVDSRRRRKLIDVIRFLIAENGLRK